MNLWESPAAIALGQAHAPKITRAMVLYRADRWHAENSVQYSMDTNCVHGWRNDCSGKVSEWFALPQPGLSTVTMLTSGPVPGSVWFRSIRSTDLEPGDVVGIMGPGTAGAEGHVRLFTGWADEMAGERWLGEDAGMYACLEQSIGGWGPDRATHRDLAEFGDGPYKAYRYVGIVDDTPPIEEEEDDVKGIPLGLYQDDAAINYAWISDGTVYRADVHAADAEQQAKLFARLKARGFDTEIVMVDDLDKVGVPAGSDIDL